jgi:hypothetical protein
MEAILAEPLVAGITIDRAGLPQEAAGRRFLRNLRYCD